MTPSEWCKKMMDEAKDGEEAMAYFELMNMWREREVKKSQSQNLVRS